MAARFRTGFRLDENSTFGTKYSFLHRIVDVEDPDEVSRAILDSEGIVEQVDDRPQLCL